jgi:hypothetical protein
LKLSTRTVVLLTTVGIALVSIGASTGAAGLRVGSGVCPTVTGVKWVEPSAPHASGTVYDLHVKGKITCAQAAKYVKVLTGKTVQTGVAFSGGPPGWTCKASPSKTGFAYFGTCQPKSEGFLPHDYFAWTIG